MEMITVTRNLTFIIILITFSFSIRSQDIPEIGTLYIEFEEIKHISKKTTKDNIDSSEIIFTIKIPNQERPSIILELDNNNLFKSYVGVNSFMYYTYVFSHNIEENTYKNLKIVDYSKNYLSIENILSVDLKYLHNIFLNAKHIYMVEKSDEKNHYRAWEVTYIN
jgi:hypothetical protein